MSLLQPMKLPCDCEHCECGNSGDTRDMGYAEGWNAAAAALNTHIWCPNCEAIKSLVTDVLSGDDVTGKFTNATDLICGECMLVIDTTYKPKTPPAAGTENG